LATIFDLISVEAAQNLVYQKAQIFIIVLILSLFLPLPRLNNLFITIYNYL